VDLISSDAARELTQGPELSEESRFSPKAWSICARSLSARENVTHSLRWSRDQASERGPNTPC